MNCQKTVCLGLAGIAAFVVAAQAPRFEVASVKKIDPGAAAGTKSTDPNRTGGGPPLRIDQGRLFLTGTLFNFVIRAYGMPGCGMDGCGLVTGGPDWVRKDIFEIQAIIPGATQVKGGLGLSPQLQAMLQALLAERFKLGIRHEAKQLPVYELAVDKGGPKANLKKAEENENRYMFFNLKRPPDTGVHLVVTNTSFEEFLWRLSPMLDRPLVDHTGLIGDFDFAVDYEKDADAPPGNAQLVGPGFFTAVREQLGLRFEAAKASVDVLVIDHVEQPSAN
jgi:uncharacterized protein (TIGR03435 family)